MVCPQDLWQIAQEHLKWLTCQARLPWHRHHSVADDSKSPVFYNYHYKTFYWEFSDTSIPDAKRIGRSNTDVAKVYDTTRVCQLNDDAQVSTIGRTYAGEW